MREILFKAKRIDNGEWVEGLLWKKKHQSNRWYISCFPDKDDNEEVYAIDEKTLCQYTGLTDKNGKKIWENDILRGHGNPKDLAKATFGEFYVIDVETLEKVDSVYGWHTEVIPTDALSKCEPFCLPMPLMEVYISRCEYEVIGNIFDNPELMKGGE